MYMKSVLVVNLVFVYMIFFFLLLLCDPALDEKTIHVLC